jgi:maltose 6'-phosphate phosphatase
MGSLISVPGFGRLLLFNTHLCSFCPSKQRQAQIEEALDFIRKVKNWVRFFYGKVRVVFAGDFNIHDNYPMYSNDPLFEYNLIINAGFADAHADYTGCDFGNNCCIPEEDPSTVEPGCTFAVDENPFEDDPNETTRIDYFFLKGLDAVSAHVVFNGTEAYGPIVSDHSGVVVELPFPDN